MISFFFCTKNYWKTARNETCPDRVREHLSEHENPKLYKQILPRHYSQLSYHSQSKTGQIRERWQRVEKCKNVAYWKQPVSETWRDVRGDAFSGRGDFGQWNYCGLGKAVPVFCQTSQIPGWEQDWTNPRRLHWLGLPSLCSHPQHMTADSATCGQDTIVYTDTDAALPSSTFRAKYFIMDR